MPRPTEFVLSLSSRNAGNAVLARAVRRHLEHRVRLDEAQTGVLGR